MGVTGVATAAGTSLLSASLLSTSLLSTSLLSASLLSVAWLSWCRLSIVHLETVRPYRPLPLFREDTLCQHYMQPEEFKQFFEEAYGAKAKPKTAEEQESDARIAAVYDMFVGAKVMRR